MFFGHSSSLRTVLSVALLGALSSLLTGCTLETTAPDIPFAGPALHGTVYGGQQPVVGAHVYLMAATVSGVGSAGYGLASTYLVNSSVIANNPSNHGQDGNGNYYVTTDSNGAFSLTGDYTCTASQQVYLYAVGGNPGAGTNSAASFMAALGPCSGLSSSTSIQGNELTTVAAAYALAGFATDALHISIPQYSTGTTADTLAATDLLNAFATAGNLVSTSTGAALTSTPAGNGTPDTAQVITLGNILAACVNASDAAPANCTTLLNNAGSTGGGSGTIPTDTATAAINIAHHPYVSDTVMSNLFGLAGGTGAPFAGGDTSQPTDFTVGISYTGSGISNPGILAVDSSGNVWLASQPHNSLSELSNTGALISASGYTGGGLHNPASLAIDPAGSVWVVNLVSSISKFSSSGSPISPSQGYNNGQTQPISIAIDGLGNAWVGNYGSISEFSSNGTAVSPDDTGYTGGGADVGNIGIAIDGSGNVWVTGNNYLAEFYGANAVSPHTPGDAVSTSSGYTGGGLNIPRSIAFDGFGNAWVSNAGASDISKFSSSGTPANSTGYTGGGLTNSDGTAVDGAGNVWVASGGFGEFSPNGSPLSPSSSFKSGGVVNPAAVAIDGSGNVWSPNPGFNSVTELVGAATPVVTPLAANLVAPYSKPASKP